MVIIKRSARNYLVGSSCLGVVDVAGCEVGTLLFCARVVWGFLVTGIRVAAVILP